MVTLVKHEWHQVDSQFAYELTDDILAEIYPDLDEDELAEKMRQIEEGEISVEEILEDADNEGVDIEWDRQYDDWWTERKGGYDVTYELGDDDSWHTPDAPPEPTHKCTKCKWTGQSYDAEWHWPEDDNEDAKQVCPYCESDIELTEHGVVEEEAKKKRMAEIDAMFAEDESDE
jgi:DNA-directed RNA polymerase subunit RPC12/RpoP